MAKRKTVKIGDMVVEANRVLGMSVNTPEERDHPTMVGMRRGIMLYLEHFLFETDNYRGFQYLVPSEDQRAEWPENDDTLRRYYPPPNW